MTIAAGLIMAMTIAGAMIAVGRRNIVHAIFGLGIALAAIALAFLMLGSPFVAAMQVLIYIGGITVAMVFGVMLSSTGRLEPGHSVGRKMAAAFVALAFFVALAPVIVQADFGPPPLVDESVDPIRAIGYGLLNEFNVAFEMLSVVLLVAIIGALAIAGRPHDEELDPAHDEETSV